MFTRYSGECVINRIEQTNYVCADGCIEDSACFEAVSDIAALIRADIGQPWYESLLPHMRALSRTTKDALKNRASVANSDGTFPENVLDPSAPGWCWLWSLVDMSPETQASVEQAQGGPPDNSVPSKHPSHPGSRQQSQSPVSASTTATTMAGECVPTERLSRLHILDTDPVVATADPEQLLANPATGDSSDEETYSPRARKRARLTKPSKNTVGRELGTSAHTIQQETEDRSHKDDDRKRIRGSQRKAGGGDKNEGDNEGRSSDEGRERDEDGSDDDADDDNDHGKHGNEVEDQNQEEDQNEGEDEVDELHSADDVDNEDGSSDEEDDSRAVKKIKKKLPINAEWARRQPYFGVFKEVLARGLDRKYFPRPMRWGLPSGYKAANDLELFGEDRVRFLCSENGEITQNYLQCSRCIELKIACLVPWGRAICRECPSAHSRCTVDPQALNPRWLSKANVQLGKNYNLDRLVRYAASHLGFDIPEHNDNPARLVPLSKPGWRTRPATEPEPTLPPWPPLAKGSSSKKGARTIQKKKQDSGSPEVAKSGNMRTSKGKDRDQQNVPASNEERSPTKPQTSKRQSISDAAKKTQGPYHCIH
jgi:hypothetical protein